jgi:hypothetical protein
VILCDGLYKAGSAVESSFTHLTVEPDFTVIFAGSNPFLLTLIVLSETVFGTVGDTDWVVRTGRGVATVA